MKKTHRILSALALSALLLAPVALNDHVASADASHAQMFHKFAQNSRHGSAPFRREQNEYNFIHKHNLNNKANHAKKNRNKTKTTVKKQDKQTKVNRLKTNKSARMNATEVNQSQAVSNGLE